MPAYDDAPKSVKDGGGSAKLPFWTTWLASTMSIDTTDLDTADLSSIRDHNTLTKLYYAGNIDERQYDRATMKLYRERHGDSDDAQPPIQILYPDGRSSDLIISPATVLEHLKNPPPLPTDITPSIKVDVIAEKFFVKYGTIDLAEATTMVFVREHTTIPVPQVHLVFSVGSTTYVVMEYIAGGDVQHLWPTMQESERRSVLLQVQRYTQEMRSISPACDTPGPLGGGVCRGRWFTEFGAGPFPSQKDLVNWWDSWFPVEIHGQPSGGLPADKPLVFTHCDIAPRNLVLHDGVVYIVDWGLAGWYPEYLEYCYLASETGSWRYPTPNEWTQELLAIVPNYPDEYKMLESISSKLARAV